MSKQLATMLTECKALKSLSALLENAHKQEKQQQHTPFILSRFILAEC